MISRRMPSSVKPLAKPMANALRTFIDTSPVGSKSVTLKIGDMPELIQIHGWAFDKSALKEVRKMPKLNIIGSHAFADCVLLQTIFLPKPLLTVKKEAFNVMGRVVTKPPERTRLR